MIYPTHNVIINNIREYNKLKECLSKCYIRNFTCSRDSSIIVDGYHQRATIDTIESCPYVSVEECVSIYNNFYQDLLDCVNNLSVGDKVNIEERRDRGEYYPCYYGNVMTKYANKTMTIKSVILGTKPRRSIPYYNGTNLYFQLEEDEDGCTWHSSMFKLDLGKPIIKLEIVPIKINSLIL